MEVPGQPERAAAEKTEPRVHQDLGWGTKAGIGIKGRAANGEVHRGEWALQSDLTAPSARVFLTFTLSLKAGLCINIIS